MKNRLKDLLAGVRLGMFAADHRERTGRMVMNPFEPNSPENVAFEAGYDGNLLAALSILLREVDA